MRVGFASPVGLLGGAALVLVLIVGIGWLVLRRRERQVERR
jgi:hypothetical protein